MGNRYDSGTDLNGGFGVVDYRETMERTPKYETEYAWEVKCSSGIERMTRQKESV